MNIAITGSTGLLGFNLTNYYAKMGHNVFVLLRDEFYKVNEGTTSATNAGTPQSILPPSPSDIITVQTPQPL